MRPSELDLARLPEFSEGAIVASVRFIAAAGPTVRVELQREDTGVSLDAEITRDRFHELALAVGDKVSVTPRNLRVFDPGPEV